jgi:ribosome biogenesis protein BMS1
MKPQKKETYMQKRAVVLGGEEKKARDLMLKVMTLRKDKETKRAAKKAEKRAEHAKKLAKQENRKQERQKRERKEYFEREGKKRSHQGGTDSSSKRARN